MSAPTKRARIKAAPEPLHFRGFPLTASHTTTLENLAADASDLVGRTISQSAIVRALVRFAGQQASPWLREHLVPHVESELDAGVLWGKKQGKA